MNAITASGLERVARCPGSFALPQVRSAPTPASKRGVVIHAFLARALDAGREAALDEIEDDDLRSACAALDFDRLPSADREGWAAEVALAYDPNTDTARELGRGRVERDYSDVRDEELCGTADVIGVTTTEVVIIDFKTGHKSVTPARSNWQLGLLGLAAARAYGRDQAHVAIVYVREGYAYYDAAALTTWDLEEWAAKIRAAQHHALRTWASVQAGDVPNVAEGEWCRYCPAYNACPAKTRLVSTLGSDPGALVSTAPSPLMPDVAAVAYRRYLLVKDALSRVHDQLAAFATANGGIDLGEGLVWGPVESEREVVDGDVARQVLVEKYGPVLADKASSWDVTKTSLKRGAQALAAERGAKVAPVERELLEVVRGAGGIQIKHSTTLKEHRR